MELYLISKIKIIENWNLWYFYFRVSVFCAKNIKRHVHNKYLFSHYYKIYIWKLFKKLSLSECVIKIF